MGSHSKLVSDRYSSPMDKLGEEILFDVLVRLPVQSLIQCKHVNKQWRTLISDPQFARASLERSFQEKNPAPCHLLLYNTSSMKLVNYKALLGDEASEEVAATAIIELDYPVKVPEGWSSKCIASLGSCHGLVCLLLEEKVDDDCDCNFILWNPTTRECRVLPKPVMMISIYGDSFCKFLSIEAQCMMGKLFYGFGYDPLSDDYKLLLGDCSKYGRAALEVFTLKTNSWRTIEIDDVVKGKLDGPGVHGPGHWHAGSLHWLFIDARKIISFDLSAERFHEEMIHFLCCLDNNGGVEWFDLGITEGDGDLFIYRRQMGLQFEVWVMKDSSWRKVYSFSKLHFPMSMYGGTQAITLTRDRKVVFVLCGKELCLYDLELNTFRTLKLHNQRVYCATATFVESLISPN